MRLFAGGESASPKTPLRILFFEDDAEDIELSIQVLKSSEFEVTSDVVDTPEAFLKHVRSRSYDVILSDFNMPSVSGMDMFELFRKEGLDIPFILVTGALGDEKAVDCLRSGVADYVLKDRLARLPMAIRRALEDRRNRLQRQQAEQALRRSEESYRSLVHSAPCGILRLDAHDGRLLDANAALAKMLGYESSSDLLNNSVAGGIVLERGLLLGLTKNQEQENQVVDCEIEWKSKDTTPLLIHLSGRLLRDQSGSPGCLEMIAENVTERRSAQERIRQLNRLYCVLSHVGQAMVRNRDERELFRRVCQILVEEGQFKMAWVAMIDSDTGRVTPAASYRRQDEEYASHLDIRVHDAPAARGPVDTAIREKRHILSNDLMRDLRMPPWRDRAEDRGYRAVGVFPLFLHGRATGAIVIYAGQVGFFDDENVVLLDELASDVSFALESMDVDRMRHRAVDELDQFFALSLDMLCVATMDGYVRRLNPAWEKTLGFTTAEMSSKRWIEFVHPEDQARAKIAFHTLQAGTELDQLELRVMSKSGSYRWLLGSAVPVLERGLVFAALRDITARKNLEEQLQTQNVALAEQNRQVQAASRMKSEFLANMSHELRSPLNGVIGFTDLLYDGKLGPLPERVREFLGRIHNSAKHLLYLINGILDLSKVEAGLLVFDPQAVSVSSIIQEVTGILSALAAEKQISITTEIDARVDSVITDPGRLKQILYNYLSNAVKFTGPGGRVVVRLKSDGVAEFRLEVSDTGVGIAEKDFSRLFVEFQQLDATKGKRYQGTGLGLALTKHLVEAQGGRVGVESKVGEGSTFFVVLPRTPGLVQADLLCPVPDPGTSRSEGVSALVPHE